MFKRLIRFRRYTKNIVRETRWISAYSYKDECKYANESIMTVLMHSKRTQTAERKKEHSKTIGAHEKRKLVKANVKACAMKNHVSAKQTRRSKTIHSYSVQIDAFPTHARNPLMQKHDRMRKMAYKYIYRNVWANRKDKEQASLQIQQKPWPMSQRIGIIRTGSVFLWTKENKTAAWKSIKQKESN